MKNPRFFLSLLLAVAAAFLLSRHAVAQLSSPAKAAGDVAMRRLMQLVSDLTARRDTNTLGKVTSLLAARDTLTQTNDVSTAVALLQRLRAGRTDEVIEVLEITLDAALRGLGASPQEIGDPQLKALEMAKQYRAEYPRKQDADVTRAFELLDRK